MTTTPLVYSYYDVPFYDPTEDAQEWANSAIGLSREEGKWLLEQMDRKDLMRCWYAAKDMRVQCYMWPLPSIPEDELPPTIRWGSPTDIGLKMMDTLVKQEAA